MEHSNGDHTINDSMDGIDDDLEDMYEHQEGQHNTSLNGNNEITIVGMETSAGQWYMNITLYLYLLFVKLKYYQ